MLTLEAGQATRAKSSHVKAVTLVRLQLMADARHGVVDETFYLAEMGLRYDYGNAGTVRDFIPMLRSVGDLVATMRHLPDAGQDQFFERRVSLVLANDFYPGGLASSGAGRLIETLRGASRTRRLIGARIEISELLIDAWSEPAAPLDLTAFAGDEHVVRFRGVVDRIGPIDEQSIGLACVSSRPRALSWPRALDSAGTPPEFLGRRLPIIYGRRWVRCVPIDVGAVSTVAAAVATTGGLELTDASRFPSSGTTTIQIGKEQLTYTGKSGNTLTGVTRGANSTVAVAHAAGEVVQEVQTTNKWAFAGHPALNIYELDVRNPFNGNMVRVRSGLLPTISYYDRTSLAGFDISTISFSNSQLKALLDELGQSSRVTQQPVVSHPVISTLSDDHPTSGDSNLLDGNFGSSVLYTNATGGHLSDTVTFAAPPGTATRQTVKVYGFCSGSHDITVSVGATTIGKIPAGGATGTYEFTTTSALGDSVTVSLGGALGDNNASGRVYEIWRDVTYSEAAPTIATATSIEAQSLGYDLEFFADVGGIPVPPGRAASPLQAFDSGSWSATRCTATLDTSIKTEGSSSLRLTIDESNTTSKDACDSTTGWTGTAALTLDTTNKTQGTGSIKETAASSAVHGALSPTYAAQDLTGSPRTIVAVDVRADLSAGDRVIFWLRSGGTNRSGWYIDADQFPSGEWRTVFIDYLATADATNGTGLTATAFDAFEVQFNNVNGASGKYVQVDNLRTLKMQCQADLTFSAANYNAGGAEYEFTVRGRQVDRKRRVFVVFAPTGGIAGGNYYQCEVGSSETLREREWRRIRNKLRASVGSPGSISSIAEMRIAFDCTLDGIKGSYPWDGGINISTWIDGFYARDDSTNTYTGAVGDLVQLGNDVLRNWVEDYGGEAYDEASSDTYIASTRVFAEMSSLTDGDWGIGLSALAYFARTNIVPVEKSTRTEWRALNAKEDFSFAAPTLALTEFDARTEAERGLEDLATRFVAMIEPDIRIDDSGEAQFTETVTIGPGKNDVGALFSPTGSELETREAAYGRIDAEVWFMPGLPGSRHSVGEHLNGSKRTIAYYARERSRIADARTVRWDGVPWYDLSGSAWGIELGDVFEHSLPWDLAAVDFRVIEVQRSFETRQATIIGVEVPTT